LNIKRTESEINLVDLQKTILLVRSSHKYKQIPLVRSSHKYKQIPLVRSSHKYKQIPLVRLSLKYKQREMGCVSLYFVSERRIQVEKTPSTCDRKIIWQENIFGQEKRKLNFVLTKRKIIRLLMNIF
jgi:hypothetical protein